jgi:hypothetical protein
MRVTDRSYTIFGNSETKVGGVSIRAPSASYAVGSKITFYGNVRLVLGGGNGVNNGKTILTLTKGGGGGVAEFLPGSKLYPQENEQMQGFDFNCKSLLKCQLLGCFRVFSSVTS